MPRPVRSQHVAPWRSPLAPWRQYARCRSQPLAGKTIVVTRPRGQARAFAAALASAGARVILAPTIRIAPPSSYESLDAGLRNLEAYQAVAFASQNAVEGFFKRARTLGLGRLRPPRRVYAVGPKTAQALRRKGWRVSRVPEAHRAEELARAMGNVRGLGILIPRAKKGREEWLQTLRRRGARLKTAECYQTLPDSKAAGRLRREAARGKIDVVAFSSPSSVRQFVAQLGKAASLRLFRKAAAASIGPVTSAALKAYFNGA